MNTIGSCPQLTLTSENNWGGHRMQNAYQTLFSYPRRPFPTTCIQLEQKFKCKQQKICQHAKDQFRGQNRDFTRVKTCNLLQQKMNWSKSLAQLSHAR